MLLAGGMANDRQIPVILDPVGAVVHLFQDTKCTAFA